MVGGQVMVGGQIGQVGGSGVGMVGRQVGQATGGGQGGQIGQVRGSGVGGQVTVGGSTKAVPQHKINVKVTKRQYCDCENRTCMVSHV